MIFKNDSKLRVQRKRISLLDGDTLQLRASAGAELQVSAGATPDERPAMLWVTEEGCFEDVFVLPGQSHVVRGNGRVMATAWGVLQVRVASAAEVESEAHDARRRERERQARCAAPAASGLPGVCGLAVSR
ncbi:MAG: DUF2917 domain-containing protein [Betaproteobacteria bacterium]|nr:DUF2917 domain-containing protein [Betaproteobacteria bacterium]